MVCLVLAAGLFYANLTRDLPSPMLLPALLDSPNGLLLQPTRIYDQTGVHLLLSLDNGRAVDRQIIPLDSSNPTHLPEVLVNATLVTADPSFWSHPGFLWKDLTSDHISTLAESLVSDLLLSIEPPSLSRNLRLRILAAQVTALYGREKVLEWYLNSANYGHMAFGVEEASELYLGKPANQLNQAESALLAAVAQAPALNPLDAPDAARANQHRVIALLLAKGGITRQQADQAQTTSLTFQKAPPPPDNPALAFTNLVQNEVAALVGRTRLERGGLVIRTTLDYDLQLQLTCTLRTQLLRVSTSNSNGTLPGGISEEGVDCPAARLLPTISLSNQATNSDLSYSLAASGLILDPQTGQILAMLGDTTIKNGESTIIHNHATGSLLTPFIYLAGFTRGLSPGSLVWDIPSSLPPTLSDQVNPDGKFHGPVRLRTAMVNDYLAPAAQLLAQIGPDVVWNSTAAFGLPSLEGEEIPFSGGELSIYQVAQAFGVLANQGIQAGQVIQGDGRGGSLDPVAVLQVQDGNLTTLMIRNQSTVRPIISTALAYLVNQALSDETARWSSLGSSNSLEIGRQAAAKLGQTANGLDTWSVGYTPQRLIAIWMGDTGTHLVTQLSGGVWHALMQYALSSLPVVGWTVPAGISTVFVCDPSGLLPTSACPNVVSEIFLNGNEPIAPDNLYQTYEIDRETGRLATIFTPADLVVDKTFLVVPSEAHPWAEAAGLPVPPELYDAIQAPPVLPEVHITSPGLFAAISGQVKITGTANESNFASYQIQVGAGLNPQAWIQIGDTSSQTVSEGLLATLDTTKLEDGLYAVRLVVVQKDQQVQTAVTQVTIDNTPPTASVMYPSAGQVIAYRVGITVILQAQAEDAIGIDRLEWWIDGKQVGTRTQAPYSFPWDASLGNHNLVVKAFDRAGNEKDSNLIAFVLK